MTKVEKRVVVDVPLSVVYNQWTQFEEFPQFMDGVEQVRPLSDGRLEWIAWVDGARRQWVAEVTEKILDEVIAWKSVDGPRNDGEVTFADVGDGQTEVRLRWDVDLEGRTVQVGDAAITLEGQTEYSLENFQLRVEGFEEAIAEGGHVDRGVRRPDGAHDADVAPDPSETEADRWLDDVGSTVVTDNPDSQ